MSAVINLNLEGVSPFASENLIDEWVKKALNSYDALLDQERGGEALTGWINLPKEDHSALFKKIYSLKQNWISRGVQFVVSIGIGGSYLGTRAIYQALTHSFQPHMDQKGVSLIFAGHTLSQSYLLELLHFLENREFAIVIISKSGSTLESSVAFNFLKNKLIDKYGIDVANERIAAVTTNGSGALWDRAQKEGWHTFDIPENIGGRFSLFTAAALLPLSLAGISIEKLMDGASYCRSLALIRSKQNSVIRYAAIRNLLYSQGKKIEALAYYSPKLHYFGEWWKQLFGESEGKDGKALFPTALNYTTDLHSLGQYVQEGERVLFETVLFFENNSGGAKVLQEEGDALIPYYLNGKELHSINRAVIEGVAKAHIEGGVPVIRVEGDILNEFTLGATAYFFQFSAALSAKLLGVDPYNQPGVEAYKSKCSQLLKDGC